MDGLDKALDHILNPPSQTSYAESSPPCSDEDHTALMLKLWVVMTESFGYRWFKPMGEEPNQTWSEGLRHLTPTQWRNGLEMLRECTEEWPPSLPEFKRWCTGRMTKDQLRA